LCQKVIYIAVEDIKDNQLNILSKSCLHRGSNMIYELLNISIKSCLYQVKNATAIKLNIWIKSCSHHGRRGQRHKIKYFNQKVI
jgi:hypothetical protein